MWSEIWVSNGGEANRLATGSEYYDLAAVGTFPNTSILVDSNVSSGANRSNSKYVGFWTERRREGTDLRLQVTKELKLTGQFTFMDAAIPSGGFVGAKTYWQQKLRRSRGRRGH